MASAAPLYKALPAPRFSWAGPYVGVHAGATWGTEEWDLSSYQRTNPPGLTLTPDKTSTHTLNGFLGGVQAGFNWQMDWVVFGAEAQFSWSNASGHGRCIEETNVGDIDFKCNTKVDYLGTAAGRLGGSVGSALLYVKGGAAWVHNSYSITSGLEGAPPISSPQASVTDTRWGWMLGTGVEFAFTPNWSAKAEYDYLDFGTKQYTFAAPGTVILGGGQVEFNVDIRQRMHLIKAGLNYHFDYGKTPVRANY